MLIKGNVLRRSGLIERTSLRIIGGLIVKDESVLNPFEGEKVFSLKDYELITPPIYDSHVHLRDLGEKDRETVYSGTLHMKRTGCFGCTAMPNTNPSLTTIEEVMKYKKIISDSAQIETDIYGLITPSSSKEQLEELGLKTRNKYKAFQGKSTGISSTMFNNNEKLLEQVLLVPEDSEVRIHCEDQSLVEKYEKENPFDPDNAITHFYARPNLVEDEGIKFVAENILPKALNKNIRIVVCHLSSKEGLNHIRTARGKYGINSIECETAYHYLYFNNDDFAEKGVLLKCNPSVKTEDDRLELMLALANGEINYLVSDHAPHSKDGKLKKYFSGLPSFNAGIFGWLIKQSLYNKEGMANIINAASLGLKPEWDISIGNKANMIFINMNGKIIDSSDQESLAKDLSPYNGEMLPYLSGYVNGNDLVLF